MTERKPRALIVGAGIAGLSTAWWLDKAGWTSIVLEKAPGIRGGGYIVGLSGTCMKAIEEMDLGVQLRDISHTFDQNVVRDYRGRELVRVAYKDVYGDLGHHSVCRGDLEHTLRSVLPESAAIRFSETLEGALEDDDGITATMKGGEVFKVDLLIGADGVRSAVRSMFWPGEDLLEDLGYSYAVYEVEQDEVLESDCVSFNYPGYLDVLYALRNGRQAALHIWRDDHLGIRDRRLGFEALREVTVGSTSQVKDVVKVAEKSGASPIIDTLTMATMPRWSKGRVLLLGDAAHCLTLMSGQGAGMAIASASILGKELMTAGSTTEALENHERKLRPQIEMLQKRSREMAAMYIPKNRFWYWLRNILIRVVPSSWIVSWHVKAIKAEIELTHDG